MTELGQLVHLLCNTPVRNLITALKRDGFFSGTGASDRRTDLQPRR